ADDFFFFSSRRRHTRWPRDWSSDVCSSDLFLAVHDFSAGDHQITALAWHSGNAVDGDLVMAGGAFLHAERIAAPGALEFPLLTRSEERRVGKEGKSRGAQGDENKKVNDGYY